MRSLILLRVAQGVLPVATLFAIYLLLRGHNHPGGGFIAGLVTASAVVLQALAMGENATRAQLARLLRPAAWVGLLVAVAAASASVLAGAPLFTHFHAYVSVPGHERVHLSTALLFDVGVYLAVVGVAATLLAAFAEDPE